MGPLTNYLYRAMIGIPVIAVLCATSYSCTRSGWAASLVYDASVEMNTWAASGNHPAEQTREWVRRDLQDALSHDPSNASAYELLGVLELSQSESEGHIIRSLDNFVHSAELRPTSPYTWANILEAMYLQG